MNNEPVAYIDPYDLERLPHYDCYIGSQQLKNGIPLYTHPADESFDRTASHMAGEYVSYPSKDLTDEEINVVAILQDAEIVPVGHEIWKTGEEFNKYKKIVLATAKALRKAQDK